MYFPNKVQETMKKTSQRSEQKITFIHLA